MATTVKLNTRRVDLLAGEHVIFDRQEDGHWRVALYLRRRALRGRFVVRVEGWERTAARSFDLHDALTRCFAPGYPSQLPTRREAIRAREIAAYILATLTNEEAPSVGKSEGASQTDRRTPIESRA